MTKRPKIITALCIFLAIAWLVNWASIAYAYGQVSSGRFAWIAGTQLVAGMSIVGIWQMRLWGPVLYFLGQTIGIANFFLMPPEGAERMPTWAIFVVPLMIAIPIAMHWKLFTLSGRKVNA